MTRRSTARYLCSEMVRIEWQDHRGALNTSGILEEIWPEGASVQTLGPIQAGTKLWIVAKRALFLGTVTECRFIRDGYFSRVAFASESRWSARSFRPEHMVNTQTIFARWLKESLTTLESPKARSAGSGT